MKRFSLEELSKSACDFMNIEHSQLVGPYRYPHLVEARRLFIWNARSQRKPYPFVEIGRFLRKDHTVIMYHAKRMGL